MGSTALATARRVSRPELEVAQLSGVQCRPGPGVVLPILEHVPDDDRDLPGRRNRRNVLAAACRDPQEEGPERPGGARRGPGRLHEHAACLASTLFGDPPMPDRPVAGLMDARVQASPNFRTAFEKIEPEQGDSGLAVV
jgi:hypothetical protein